MSVGLNDPLDERRGRGARVSAWIHFDAPSSAPSRRELMRVLGLRGQKRYPVQARQEGGGLVLRCDAHYSPLSNQSRGSLRAYLERVEAQAPDTRNVYHQGVGRPDNVLQDAPLETWPDRWSIWIKPSEHDVNPFVAIHALAQELERRFGIDEEDVYAVQHAEPKRPDRWHLHAVMPALKGMQLDRDTMRDIAAELVRELVLERAVERALDPVRAKPDASGWDLPATDAQMAVLRGRGRASADLTRGEASQAIESVTGERSWFDEGRGR